MEILPRFCKVPKKQSFFLFGPRGTGKTQFLRQYFPDALSINLLLPQEFSRYTARPEAIIPIIEGFVLERSTKVKSGDLHDIILDEVQKVPALLSVIHELMERPIGKKVRFILTGSSSRKLKSSGADLLAGRALTLHFYPFMAKELGSLWDLTRALEIGTLPVVWSSESPHESLSAYIGTYLKEEVLQERMTRNLDSFARFLEVMTFSQGSPLNISSMGREAHVQQKTAEAYVELIEDLLIGARLNIFQRRAKRELSRHSKFYFFDCGIYKVLRPMGPLDDSRNIEGIGLETLVYQHIRAWANYRDPTISISFWRTRSNVEVDFVIYGKNEFVAIEVKNSSRIRSEDLTGLRSFGEDYPEAKLLFLHRGTQVEVHEKVTCVPVDDFLKTLEPDSSLWRY